MRLGIHRTASAIRLRWIQRSTPFMPIQAVFSRCVRTSPPEI